MTTAKSRFWNLPVFHTGEVRWRISAPPPPPKRVREVSESPLEEKSGATELSEDVLAGYREYRRIYMREYRKRKKEEK